MPIIARGAGGINTFDATAGAEDIAEGKTAYAKGKKLTGTKKEKYEVAYGETTAKQFVPYFSEAPGVFHIAGEIKVHVAGYYQDQTGKYNYDKEAVSEPLYVKQSSYAEFFSDFFFAGSASFRIGAKLGGPTGAMLIGWLNLYGGGERTIETQSAKILLVKELT